MTPDEIQSMVREQGPNVFDRMFAAVGFVRDRVIDVTVFLDGPDGKPGQGVHILRAEQKVKPEYASPTPSVEEVRMMNGKRIVDLTELVAMKLNSYRRKDQAHLQDMIQIGLIDSTWPSRFDTILARRLQDLVDDPEG